MSTRTPTEVRVTTGGQAAGQTASLSQKILSFESLILSLGRDPKEAERHQGLGCTEVSPFLSLFLLLVLRQKAGGQSYF